MPIVTLSEASQALGFKSRSTLYRLRDAGDLTDYIRPPASPGGAQLLELEPRGLPPLREAVSRLIRPQVNNWGRGRQPRIDPRWGEVAGLLSEAMAGCGGLALCDTEAHAIAAALPQALGKVFGEPGLELLRVALADAGCWRAGPRTPPNPEGTSEFWSEFGRWEPGGEPLEDGPFWQHVAAIVTGMMGGDPFEQLGGIRASQLHHELQDGIAAVAAGARWDDHNWAAASARSLLDDGEVAAGGCPHSLPELQQLAAGGLLSPELQAETEAALAAYAAKGITAQD
jgi:hypothetical protein